MGFLTYMQKRESGYYFRKKVPLDLIEVVGKREIVESLQTKDLSEATGARMEEIGQSMLSDIGCEDKV